LRGGVFGAGYFLQYRAFNLHGFRPHGPPIWHFLCRQTAADGKTDAEFFGKEMTREEFRTWSKAASKAKADYQRKLITGDEMMRIVKT